MKFSFNIDDHTFQADSSRRFDLSIPLSTSADHTRAWYVDPMRIEPVRTEQFTGSVAEGGSVNFRDIYFNPHGHGTHTECVGHIAKTVHSVNKALEEYFSLSVLLSVETTVLQSDRDWMKVGDHVIGPGFLTSFPADLPIKSLIIRTRPNTTEKLHKNYSASNPPYLLPETMERVVELGIDHLLIDLPSVDREMDGGRLHCHHLFWQYPKNTQHHKTITEFIYVPDQIQDGVYFLELQVAPFENDASPSRPIIYPIS